MKKLVGTLHLWLGLTSGLVVFIISITGCIYVFQEELSSLLYKKRLVVEIPQDVEKKSLSELLVAAQAAAGEKHPIQFIEVPKDEARSYVFRPMVKMDKKAATHFGEIVYQHKIYVNPYTAEIIKDENTKYEFFTIILRLHRNLLLNRSIGLIVVGSSVLIFVIMLITGIVLWWPANKAAIQQRISLMWKSTTRFKRKNYDLHNVFGFYGAFFLLIIALTGLTWAFDWFDHGVQWVANGGAKTERQKNLFSDTTQTKASLPVNQILFDLKKNNPEAHTFTFNLPEKAKGVVNASARSGIHIRYTTNRYQYDQYSAKNLKTSTFNEKNSGEKLRAMTYDIHTGSILGFPGKILAFLASLISASLPVTGFLIWYNRKFAMKKTALAFSQA